MTAINALPEAAKTEVLEKLKKFGISSTEPAASSDAVGEEDDLFAVMAKVEAKPDLMGSPCSPMNTLTRSAAARKLTGSMCKLTRSACALVCRQRN